MSSHTLGNDIGVLPGKVGTQRQFGRLKTKVELSRIVSGESGRCVMLRQTALYPAKQDEMVETELPLHKMKQLRDVLDERIEKIESRE